MPNIHKGSPPREFVFVYFKDTAMGASRYGGYANVWLRIRKNANNDLFALKPYTGCGTEYGIEVSVDGNKYPIFTQETS